MSPMPVPKTIPRYHSLDRLRAAMMLLGLVLHTAINYFPFPVQEAEQIYLDPRSSVFFDYLVKFIHSFRMPVFFVIAGFFAAFLFERRGPAGFLRHRWARIGVPLIGAWIAIYPATALLAVWANTVSAGRPLTPLAPVSARGILDTALIHLWFLYFLLIYCAVARFAVPLARRLIPDGPRERLLDGFSRAARRAGGTVLFALPTAITLYPMRTWTFDPSAALLPAPHHLAAFGVFFVYGWLVYARREILDGFKKGAWTHLVLGLLLHGAYLYALRRGYGVAGAEREHLLAIACLALSVWSLVYGFMGLFLRYLETPSAAWRYISDASYWMYLVHLPVTVALPPLLAGIAVPAGVKFSLVLGATAAITLITYHYWVRATFIGLRLNGRRYPRAAPWRAAKASDREAPSAGRNGSSPGRGSGNPTSSAKRARRPPPRVR